MVEVGKHVANFSTCERYGYTPELHAEVLALNPDFTEGLTWEELEGFIVDLMNDKVQLNIDPILVNLEPR